MVPDRFARFAAIDWSGAVGPRQRGIAVALAEAGEAPPQLIRPDAIWSRTDVARWICDQAGSDTVIGVDLGLSLPFLDAGAFFPGWSESPADARALWALVDRLCAPDPHLAATSFVDHPHAARHFRRHGGRTGDLFGTGRGRLRVTEEAQRRQGLSPYSNFNLVGAAQVGKSSLTGMRVVHRLGAAMPIWPFDADPGHGALLLEIYTSIAALAAGRPRGRTKMTTHESLDTALAAIGSATWSSIGGGSGPIDDHKSDALLTAAWLRADWRRTELWAPAGMTPHVASTEGWTFGVT
ncbi:MAG TPA: hypothetical protein VFQ57_02010 [Sphingomonas sp.]|nr:hypothetical protein [Sphingomonas sp.]